jgi:UDP-N-acetylmuramate dehydrogenase
MNDLRQKNPSLADAPACGQAERSASSLVARPDVEWIENAPLVDYNSMGIRATARRLAIVHNEAGLRRFLEWVQANGEDFFILGDGTNIIFVDEVIDGVLLHLGGEFAMATADEQEPRIKAGAAVALADLVEMACQMDLAGLEGAWGLPGSLGGALVGNAGTHTWKMCDCVESIEALDRSGARHRLARSEIDFRYHDSGLRGMIVMWAYLVLQPDDPARIEERIAQARVPRSRHPHDARSAGCAFRNPPGTSAGKLIEAAGLKGLRRGDAVVSDKHANFIINEGNARGCDVVELIDEIRRRVAEKFGITLETEVQLIRSGR